MATKMQVLSLFVILVMFVITTLAIEEICSKAKSCQECMGQGPPCGWCFSQNYDASKYGLGYRCASKSVLLNRKCPEADIQEGVSKVDDPKVETFGEDVQLKPLTRSATLRPRETRTIDFNFDSIKDYPVDLYFLTDVSYSMKLKLATVASLAQKIAEEMRTITKRFRVGFGAFVDKPVVPFIAPDISQTVNPCLGQKDVNLNPLQCVPPFSYKHFVNLTTNISAFSDAINAATVKELSGNLDSPEGGLDALMQVAHCQNLLNYDANARKIALIASDGPFHLAGDGKLAGLVQPPPRKCETVYQADRYNKSLKYLGWHDSTSTDYPSLGEIQDVLQKTDMSVIFATIKEYQTLYEELASFLPSAAVGVIDKNAENIVKLLRSNYEKIASTIELRVTPPDEIAVKVMTQCHGESGFTEKAKCSDHPVGMTIKYRLVVEVKQCFVGEKKVSLQILGLKDKADLLVKSMCACDKCSGLTAVPNDPLTCNKQGSFLCGTCTCNTGFVGEFCECSTDAAKDESKLIAQCTAPSANQVCSGRGRCTCGKCVCSQPQYTGTYCECDSQGCPRAADNNKVCGGLSRGNCLCNGTCTCQPGYKGAACDCIDSTKGCQDPGDPTKPMCSGKGKCDCGVCFCDNGWTGLQCNERQGGEGALCSDESMKQCVLCLYGKLMGDGTMEPECSARCNQTRIDVSAVSTVPKYSTEDGSNLCIIYDERNCRIYYTYRYLDLIVKERQLKVKIQETKDCPTKVETWIIIVAVVGAIVGIGIILLLIWKMVITIDDRRELAKFQKESANAQWEMEENPIFKAPVTSVNNPMYTGGAD